MGDITIGHKIEKNRHRREHFNFVKIPGKIEFAAIQTKSQDKDSFSMDRQALFEQLTAVFT
ncbi:hypothetical protein NUACC26_100390 [Scytonema sp. NUACC26]